MFVSPAFHLPFSISAGRDSRAQRHLCSLARRQAGSRNRFLLWSGGRIVLARRGAATITSLPHFESSFRERASRGDLKQAIGWLGVRSMTHFHGRVMGLMGPPGGSFSIPSFIVPFVLCGPSLRAIVLSCHHLLFVRLFPYTPY